MPVGGVFASTRCEMLASPIAGGFHRRDIAATTSTSFE